MSYPYLSRDCSVMHKGVSVATDTMGRCAGELLYHFSIGQPHTTDEKGALIWLAHEQLVKAHQELPTEIEAYLQWAAQKGVMPLESARWWTVGDFQAVRAFIEKVAATPNRIWLDYGR